MKLTWSPEALEDLRSIQSYIAAENPDAARSVVMAIVRLVEIQLPEHPRSGRPGRVEGTRELVMPNFPYIVPYCIAGDEIEILGVQHAARTWPEGL